MADREMTNEEAIEILGGIRACYNIFDEYDEPKCAALSKAIFALKAEKDVFYDGYAYCLLDFGKDTVLCKDCKHWGGETHGCEKRPSAEPWWETDSCNYGERKGSSDD